MPQSESSHLENFVKNGLSHLDSHKAGTEKPFVFNKLKDAWVIAPELCNPASTKRETLQEVQKTTNLIL